MRSIAMFRLPYIVNLLILVPVVSALLLQPDSMSNVFGTRLADSATLRPLVACLWLGVLICSVIALAMPQRFWPHVGPSCRPVNRCL